MPKLGMEPIRKAALVKAAIAEIGHMGSLEVTVAQIARRAGMSSALAHHYFGSKEALFLAAMRHILRLYGAEVRGTLRGAEGPQARLRAILTASFAPGNFRRETIGAWLHFWALAHQQPGAHRLWLVYQGRLSSNLRACLRPLVGAGAPALARRLGALIDGLYLREALSGAAPDGPGAVAQVMALVEAELAAARGAK